jgi:3',5'-cyclic AMP phosphodiesterase CpdA
MLLAQLSDLHVGVEFTDAPQGFSAARRVSAAIAYLNGLDVPPVAVMLTGDLTADGKSPEYQELRALLSELHMPYYLIPGNHDNRENLRAVFSDSDYLFQHPERMCFIVDDFISGADQGNSSAGIRLIGLDTLQPGKHEGQLGNQQLAWLDRALALKPDVPTAVVLHHPPFMTHMPIFDAMGCTDGTMLADVVRRHSQVKLVASGHVHRSIQVNWHGTLAIAMSSVVFQYPLNLSDMSEKLLPDFHTGSVGLSVWSPGQPVVNHEKLLFF